MKYEIEQMLKQEKDPNCPFAIVNTSSTAGIRSMPEFSAYAASKHAIIGLTKSSAVEYAKDLIRINAIAPATTDTPMIERFITKWPELQEKINAAYPVGRICTPQEIAEAVVWLCSPLCSFLTGHVMVIDGGSTC